jgi:hypothetical protein
MRLWKRRTRKDLLSVDPPQVKKPKRITYCIVPKDLESKLFDTLRRHYASNREIEVIVERRVADRRVAQERRKRNVGPPPGVDDRRRIRNEGGRRIAERRAQLIPIDPPDDVPRKVRKYLAYPDEEEGEEGEASELGWNSEEEEYVRVPDRF